MLIKTGLIETYCQEYDGINDRLSYYYSFIYRRGYGKIAHFSGIWKGFVQNYCIKKYFQNLKVVSFV